MKEKNIEPKRVSDFMPGRVDFFPQAIKHSLDSLVMEDEEVIILDAIIIEDWKSDFGLHDFALIAFELHGDTCTTISSGEVILKKIKRLIEAKAFPVIGRFVREKRYYDLL